MPDASGHSSNPQEAPRTEKTSSASAIIKTADSATSVSNSSQSQQSQTSHHSSDLASDQQQSSNSNKKQKGKRKDDYWPPITTARTLAEERARNGGVLAHGGTRAWAKQYRTEIAASTASLASTLVAYPLDSVKTRMQAYKFSGFVSCVTHTYKTEGLHGFWRGVAAPLASITLVRTVSFSIYQKAKYAFDDMIYRTTGESPLVRANTNGAYPNFNTVLCFGAAGATSGALITAIACPFELTKLSAQIAVLMEYGVSRSYDAEKTSQPLRTMGTLATAKKIVRNRGVFGLYSGFHLHVLRDTIGTSIYFMTYESCKQMLANARGNSPGNPTAVVIAGGLCGLVSWAAIYPIDTAKSIYQRNVLTAGTEKAKTAKIMYFNPRRYRGLGVSMTRSCLINAVFFSVFEFMKRQINRMEIDEPHG